MENGSKYKPSKLSRILKHFAGIGKRFYGGNLWPLTLIVGTSAIALKYITHSLYTFYPAFITSIDVKAVIDIVLILLGVMGLIPLIFTLISKNFVDFVAKEVTKDTIREISNHLQTEFMSGCLREFSSIMYINRTGEAVRPTLGKLLEEIHVRTKPIAERHAIAYCLLLLSRESLGKLKIPLNLKSYKEILKELLAAKIFDRLYWTCPFSPVYLLGEDGWVPENWVEFSKYGANAVRIVYLKETIFRRLILADKLVIERSMAENQIIRGKTFNEYVNFKINQPNSRVGSYFTVGNPSGNIIVDVRAALLELLNNKKETGLFFSCPEKFQTDFIKRLMPEEAQQIVWEYCDTDSRKNAGLTLEKDYGICCVEGSRDPIVLTWDPDNSVVEIYFGETQSEKYLSPFKCFEEMRKVQSKLPPSVRFLYSADELVAMINERGGRKIVASGGQYILNDEPVNSESITSGEAPFIIQHISSGALS